MARDALKTAGNVVGTLAVVGVVVLTVLFVFPGAVGAEASYVVLSDSMSPQIQAGDMVVVQSVDPATLSEGDIITYESARTDGPTTVTHRIVSVVNSDGERQFRTKGDANEDADPNLVSQSDVTGRVWFHVPLVGHLVMFASADTGLVLFVIVPSLLLVANEAYSLYNDVLPEEEDSAGRLK